MNIKMSIASIMVFSSLLLTGCGGSSSEDNKATYDSNGEKIFQNNSCVGCHGKDLQGASGPSLQKVGSELSEAEIEKTINEGKGSMPGELVDKKEAKEVAKWLSEQK